MFVGVGNGANLAAGDYQAITPGGQNQWTVQENNPPKPPGCTTGSRPLSLSAISRGAGIATDRRERLRRARGIRHERLRRICALGLSVVRGGLLVFTTPALADVLGNGQTQIIEGGDSTAGLAYNYQYSNGGHLRVCRRRGNFPNPEPNDGGVRSLV